MTSPTRPRKKCRICADVKVAAWVHVLLEEGYSPRRIARDKGASFTRRQVQRHVDECTESAPEEHHEHQEGA